MAAGPACLLDLTRSVARLGQGPMTGIDRVEAAWAQELIKRPKPAYALIRSSAGFLLLDRAGMAALFTQPLPARADWVSRLSRANRVSALRARAETLARRLAIARCSRIGLAAMVRRHIGDGGVYLNLGHANLSDRTLQQIRRGGLSVTALVHDTIPLDYPDFARFGTAAPFLAKLAAVSRHADRVVHLAKVTRETTERHLAALGRVPPGVVAPLGLAVRAPDLGALPAGLPPESPYFVVLGTIEPRKNIGLLLDVWQMLSSQPTLLLIGRRGWIDAAMQARLDALPKPGPIVELPDLSDAAVTALLAGARALLFPSHAEGFGLPPLEAAALGIPVIVQDLPIFREVLGDYPVYVSGTSRYSWAAKVEELVSHSGRAAAGGTEISLPQWSAHFKTVLSPD